MPRGRTPDTVPMLLTIEPGSGPRHLQVYAGLRDAILRGTLRHGDRLPSTRILARDLGVSRTTVINAFLRLHTEGYIIGKAGGGTRVAPRGDAAEAPPIPSEAATAQAPISRAAQTLMAEGKWRRLPGQMVPFVSIASPELFPLKTWTRLTARRWRLSGKELLLPGDPQGYPPLREAVARYAVTARGVRCTAEQVMIVNGAQHAIDLCARILVDPGDAVWMESPGYLPARGVLAATGARLVDVPVDADGIDVAEGWKRAPHARLAFVTPSFQFPLGVTMSLARRRALLAWAREKAAWIVEDDYNGEYCYDSAPIQALQGLDAGGRVLYVGTFDKMLSPAMRLGFLILPRPLVAPFTRARFLMDVHSPVPEQAVLADFIEQGHWARHVRRIRTLYEERLHTFLALAARELAGLVTVDPATAGLHLLGWLPPGVSDQAVAQEARRRGVVVEPLSWHLGAAPPRSGLILGYGGNTATQMRAAMRVLAEVIRGL